MHSPPPDPPAAAPTFRLLAQCTPGLEELLLVELQALGIRARTLQGGAAWEGGWKELVQANLHLRTASRVLVELGSFGARALGELERKGGGVDWSPVHRAQEGLGTPVHFRVSSSRSRLYHEGAVEERLRRAAGLPPAPPSPQDAPPADATPSSPRSNPPGDTPPAAPPERPPVLVVVRVHRDQVTLRLDTSGAHLHRRGYRTHVGPAPLRETLAAALLLVRDAPDREGNTPPASARALLDPFCGAGTLPIEAALLARRIPPGMASPGHHPRDYAFLHWPDAPLALFRSETTLAASRILPAAPAPILGSDRDATVVRAARENALRAGVADDIRFAVSPFSSAPLPEPPPAPGWVVTNPPWGTRLGERKRLRALYQALGRSFQAGGRLAGWGLLYLSGDPVLDRATGLPLEAEPRLATTHGGLRVRAVALAPGGIDQERSFRTHPS